jgi:hypothetical protein
MQLDKRIRQSPTVSATHAATGVCRSWSHCSGSSGCRKGCCKMQQALPTRAFLWGLGDLQPNYFPSLSCSRLPHASSIHVALGGAEPSWVELVRGVPPLACHLLGLPGRSSPGARCSSEAGSRSPAAACPPGGARRGPICRRQSRRTSAAAR